MEEELEEKKLPSGSCIDMCSIIAMDNTGSAIDQIFHTKELEALLGGTKAWNHHFGFNIQSVEKSSNLGWSSDIKSRCLSDIT